jgi:hypothetical protein
MWGAMAVRAFDITSVSASSVSVLERAPRTRRDSRRERRRYGVVAVIALAVPFVAALIVLGVGH